jgi:GntR family transcriptional regulator
MIRTARSSRKTLTDAAQEVLRQAIARGTFRPGSQLPTEAALGQMLGASRTVVREALRILEDDGLISRRHGIGTFVRKDPILKNLNVNYGITEMIQLAGLTPGTSHFAIRSEKADDEVAAGLQLDLETPVITVERVRVANDKPVVYSLDSFAETLLGGAPFDSDRVLSESVYEILENEFAQTIAYGVARILPAKAPPYIAEKLRLATDALLIYLVQTDYSPRDEPILYSREYHLPDAFDFMIWRRGPSRPGV